MCVCLCCKFSSIEESVQNLRNCESCMPDNALLGAAVTLLLAMFPCCCNASNHPSISSMQFFVACVLSLFLCSLSTHKMCVCVSENGCFPCWVYVLHQRTWQSMECKAMKSVCVCKFVGCLYFARAICIFFA